MKEVNFSFFTSVRFLGLGLKILFHKNKEIKRMLSKKMAFSLMSLITIIALAFAVPSAMGDAFEIKIAGRTAVNYAVIGNPPVIDNDGAVMVMLKVSSGQPIANLVLGGTLATDDTITVYAFDKDGFLIDLTENDTGTVAVVDQEITAYPMKTPKEHRLLVTITPDEVGSGADAVPDIAKVIIEIKGAIKSADPTLATADASSKADAGAPHNYALDGSYC